LQAQARCHRIGQTKNVKVYRFLTRKTYEMRMFHLGSLKMGLDKAILQGIESKKEVSYYQRRLFMNT
jgi:SNF2 family DNA or RNA helicase